MTPCYLISHFNIQTQELVGSRLTAGTADGGSNSAHKINQDVRCNGGADIPTESKKKHHIHSAASII